MIHCLGDSGRVDDACVGGGGGGDDDWYCNHSQQLIMNIITMTVLTFSMMMEINIDIDKSYCCK